MTEAAAAVDDKAGAAAGTSGAEGGKAASGGGKAEGASTIIASGSAGTSGAAGADGDGKTVEAKWPDDWRDQMAGGDDKTRKLLERYSSPSAVSNALAAAQQKIRAGELRPAFPKDGKPEDQARWRAEMGLPESPDKYEIKVDGVDQWDPDTVKGLKEVSHRLNLKPEDVNELTRWYAEDLQRRTDAQNTEDQSFKEESEDALRAEWGNDYRGNIERINNLLNGAPSGVKDELLGARLSSGKALASHPGVISWLVNLSRELFPAATVVPAGGANAKGVEDRIREIEKVMQTDRKAYNKDEAMQKEYRDLVDMRERMKQKAA